MRIFVAVLPLLVSAGFLLGQTRPQPVWTDQEKPIVDQIKTLRKVPDSERGEVTRKLARQIRSLAPGTNRLSLAGGLAGLSTEGDFGFETLQEVATTLAAALRDTPPPASAGPAPYSELAQLVYYEHVKAPIDNPQFAAATEQLKADDRARQAADFTLDDLNGHAWHLKDLHGKVVLLNFWATWCPPCRKEMPDLQKLYMRFRDQDLVVLAISDEDVEKVKPFIAAGKYSYPVLLDPGRKINGMFRVEGIPKNFVFDRSGNLAAQSIDMRTERQFLEMLAAAGLK